MLRIVDDVRMHRLLREHDACNLTRRPDLDERLATFKHMEGGDLLFAAPTTRRLKRLLRFEVVPSVPVPASVDFSWQEGQIDIFVNSNLQDT